MAAALLLAAAASALIPLVRSRSRGWTVAAALVLVGLVAFPLRERVHMLGDTAARLGAISSFLFHLDSTSLVGDARQIHAAPLDFAVDFLAPVGLHGLGVPASFAMSCLSFALGLIYFAGAARVASRITRDRAIRSGVVAALVLSGALEVYAGYAESAGLVLAVGAWWWSRLLAPVRSGRDAGLAAGAWLVLVLSHRVGIAMLLPQVWRAVGPAFPADDPRARRSLLLWSAVAAVAAAGVIAAQGEGVQLGRDAGELMLSLRSFASHVAMPSDIANLLVLIAPLALLAPGFAGGAALRGFLARPEAKLVAVAALPLLPFATLVGPTGLGLHRDWDASVLLGWTLTVGAVAAIASLPPNRVRGALVVALPLATLVALGWVAVNADEAASLRRADALATRPPLLGSSQRAQALLFLAGRAVYDGQIEEAARRYQASYELAPAPQRGILAARAWAATGHEADALNMLDRLRARSDLDPETRARADTLARELRR